MVEGGRHDFTRASPNFATWKGAAQQYHGTIGKNAILRNNKELEVACGEATAGHEGGLNVHSLTLPGSLPGDNLNK